MLLRPLCLAAALFYPQSGDAIETIDDYRNRVELAAPARRVISLAPHLTEVMYAAGAGTRLVGAVDFSDYPQPARALPRVGNDAAIDLEAVLALRPDLVVAWPNAASRRAIDRIADLGIPVYRSEPRALDDIARTLERIGTLAGTSVEASREARRFRERAAALAARYSGSARLRAFYQVWDRPLLTVNGEHIISRVFELCGAVNVFAAAPVLVPEVDRESLLRANPEVIVGSAPAGAPASWLEHWRAYPGISAAARGHLVSVPAELIQRHTPRILDGAEKLCRAFQVVRTARS